MQQIKLLVLPVSPAFHMSTTLSMTTLPPIQLAATVHGKAVEDDPSL